ncbi:hypothetical protein [Rhizobium grahamii]|uniref:Uncharacterized protein n=1 Tax=Rhizobium grahamii TaxID=1120045 RepID=A0A370KH28_9HYPH|nr:hypothetical protein [Rhizobium grahamii]RDJ04249.1 hypothetical protein B5K06_27700 [Rhizobium grahamii]
MNLVSIFRRHDPHHAGLESNLLELGLNTRKLESGPRRALRQERTRLLNDGRVEPSLLAVRLFVWYVAESKMFDPRVLVRPGAIGLSISTMRRWAARDPVIAATVEIEISSIKLFLYQIFETLDAPDTVIAAAQERLLDS